MRHDELIADAVEAHGGSFIKSMGEGDSTVSVFDSAPAAVAAALAANRALAAEEWPPGIRIAARWGLHTGEAERRDADYFGPTVNLAARVRAQADGGADPPLRGDRRARRRAPARRLLARRPRPAPPRGRRRAGAHPRARGPGRPSAAAGDRVPVPRPARLRGRTTARFFFGREDGRGGAHRAGSRPAGCSPSSARRAAASPRVLRAGVVAAVRAGEVAGLRARRRCSTPGADARARRRRRAGPARRRRPVRGAVHAVRRRRSPAGVHRRAAGGCAAPSRSACAPTSTAGSAAHAELARAVAANQVLLGADERRRARARRSRSRRGSPGCGSSPASSS